MMDPMPDCTPSDSWATTPPSSKANPPAIPFHPPTVPAIENAGQTLGNYELLRELGRGGMGVVYQATQQGLNRAVAVKMLLPNTLTSESDRQRFRTEVEATAGLQHPHIVRVYEFGEVGGRPFYSMDYIDGPSLAERMRDGPLPNKVAARYLLSLAHAVQYAHDHHILHRDLKPSNVLLDSADRPYVTDFGLAKVVGNDAGLTSTGAVLGTPSYMAPEQAEGKKDLTPAIDVYALGGILYALVTGRPPFRSQTSLETLKQVIEQEPAAPRQLNPKVDHDLETMCLKCLEKTPCHRYASARDLAIDLERYLAGESIRARNVSLLTRLARTLGRSSLGSEFEKWGTMLVFIGAIIFVCHVANFVVSRAGLPLWSRWITAAVQFLCIGMVYWRYRPGRLLPTTSAERHLASIWIGYFVGCATAVVVTLLMADREVVARVLTGKAHPGEWSLYPYSAMMAGFAFFVMGNNYWGGCYVIGLTFFSLAILMPLTPALAPLEFATLLSVTLFILGVRLRRLEHAGEHATDGGNA